MFILGHLILVSRLHFAVQTKSPVEKVVQLITELKAKIEADGANEQKIYDKFACWCETTTKRKADNIEAGKALIGTTTTHILTLKGAIAVLASEIADNEASIAENNDAMKKLTSIRTKENGDYQQEKAYKETAIASLHKAIEVLNGAGTGMALLKAAAKVRSAVLGSDHLSELSEASANLLKSFLESPDKVMLAQTKLLQTGAPQSATVMGILKDMYDTFARDLEDQNKAESTAQMNFEQTIADKTESNRILTEANTAKASTKAEKNGQLSEATELLQATQAQLKDDEDFFTSAEQSCKDKADAWGERGRLRTEELSGINKALGILTSDDARKMFAASAERPQDTFGSDGVADLSFVQTEEMNTPRMKAYQALKKIVKQTKSLSLARLAAQVRTATQGHFDDVIASIDDMVTVMNEEEKEDITQRDWCIEERNTERNNRDDMAYDIKQLGSKIERAELKKSGLQKNKADTIKASEDQQASIDAAWEDRQAENVAFHAAKDDDLAAIQLLTDATAAMTSYGDNNAAPALLQKQPVFEVSEDQAPDAQFSDSGKHDGATGGIVALLTQLKENLENEVSTGTKAEAKATLEFDALKAASDKQMQAYADQVTGLEASIASTDEELLEDDGTKGDVTGEKDGVVEYLGTIKGNCDWIEGAFTKRAEARKQESEGLQQAKAILAGSEGGDFGFMQKK